MTASKELKPCRYVSQYYDVPADIGRRVIVSGKQGIIVADRGNYIGVNFDQDKPGVILNCHPTDNVVYGEIGRIRKVSRSRQRYLDYLHADTGLTFAEWLGIGRTK